MIRFRFLLVLGFSFGLTALARDVAVPPSGLAGQVAAHFARWDRNADGTLSREEIDRAVADPSIKGAEAAAVATLKRAMRGTKTKLPPLTRPTLDDLANGKGSPDLRGMYAVALGKITKANRDLFARGLPSLEGLSQGKLGDCFCLAPLGSMVCRQPKDVVAMIRPQPDGTFKVRLGHQDVAVSPPTDAELALTASAGADGLWVNVYEKAVGLVRQEKGGAAAASLIDLLGKGGSAGTTIELVTGHKIVRFSCKFAKDPALGEIERQAKLADLRQQLTAAFRDNRLVTCGTVGGVTTPGIHGNHAYAVTGYDAKADEIALWNPHGQTFIPKGQPGFAHGYPTKNGRFRVPLPEYVRVFGGLAFETTEQAAK